VDELKIPDEIVWRKYDGREYRIKHEIVWRDGQEVCRIWMEGDSEEVPTDIFEHNRSAWEELIEALVEAGHLTWEIDMQKVLGSFNNDGFDAFIYPVYGAFRTAGKQGSFLDVSIIGLSDRVKRKWQARSFDNYFHAEGSPVPELMVKRRAEREQKRQEEAAAQE